MENLFLDAMEIDQLTAINQIKENKQFAIKLINDLSKVFHTYHKVEDETDCCRISTRVSERYDYGNAFSFTATKNGITFMARPLGYYKANNPKIKSLGGLYEKYQHTGTTADPGFFESGFGRVRFNIPINPKDSNIRDILKDIIYLMESEGYKKFF